MERYDAGPKDLSMLSTYADFLTKYDRIINNAVSLLKQDHLAVFVVGNLRDETAGIMCDH